MLLRLNVVLQKCEAAHKHYRREGLLDKKAGRRQLKRNKRASRTRHKNINKELEDSNIMPRAGTEKQGQKNEDRTRKQ